MCPLLWVTWVKAILDVKPLLFPFLESIINEVFSLVKPSGVSMCSFVLYSISTRYTGIHKL